jgi:hypothetical protein
MKKNIQIILDDLYKIDPSLKKMEADLKKIITSLVSIKPEVRMDEDFRAKLRDQILSRIEELQEKKTRKFSFANIFSSKVPAYSLITSLVLVLFISGAYFSQKSPEKTIDFNDVFKVTPLKNNAFGTLSEEGATFSAPESGQRIGNELDVLTSSTVNTEMARATNLKGIGAGGGDNQFIGISAPEWINYTYTYVGDEIDFDQSTVSVLKRKKGSSIASNLSNMIKGLDFELINLNSFPSSEVENLTLSQNKQYGYSVYLGFNEGIVSIFKNWRMWPNPWAECNIHASSKSCAESKLLSKSDVPSDVALIKISNNFLKKHSINISAYGKPIINNDWQIRSEGRFVPEEIQIVYPLELDGKMIYEVSGNIIGLNISIDIRNKKVAGLYNLTTREHEESGYAAASLEDVLKVAQNGGINNNHYQNPNQKTVKIELDTPYLGYLNHYKHNPAGYSEELLIPALIFPIKNVRDNPSYQLRKNIVVPLADEMLQSDNNNTYPMPLLETTRSFGE